MATDPAQLESVELLFSCAENRDDTELWSEFLRRFAPKIKIFIRGTIRQEGNRSCSGTAGLPDEVQGSDLFQNTIVRLIENDCAAIKRFSGDTESELLAYLAVITRSVVRDYLRWTRALKRVPVSSTTTTDADNTARFLQGPAAPGPAIERGILIRELNEISVDAIRNNSGPYSARDLMIFKLYFDRDLSIAQIAGCKGLKLSKTGVEKVLNRLKNRIRSVAASSAAGAVELR